MFEVTEENYLQFLSYHGRSCDCCKIVVEKYFNSDEYHNLMGVKIWVDASIMFLKMENCDADYS